MRERIPLIREKEWNKVISKLGHQFYRVVGHWLANNVNSYMFLEFPRCMVLFLPFKYNRTYKKMSAN